LKKSIKQTTLSSACAWEKYNLNIDFYESWGRSGTKIFHSLKLKNIEKCDYPIISQIILKKS